MSNHTLRLPRLNEIWQETCAWQPDARQQDLLQRLYEEILTGNRQLNLTRITEPEEFWEKHVWDSLRGVKSLGLLAAPAQQSSRQAIDIGTGAGFPGIPVAIASPQTTVTLLDSTHKKIAFLNTLLSQLAIQNTRTLTARVEAVGHNPKHREAYDLAFLRAVGSATVCAEYALPLLKLGGVAVLYRGHWTAEEQDSLQAAIQQLGGSITSVEKYTTPLSQSIRHSIYLEKRSPTPRQFPRPVGTPNKEPL